MRFRPLSASLLTDLSKLVYPVYGSPKLDGIRSVIHEENVLSKSLKPIPNLFVRKELEGLNDLDGELIIDGLGYNDINSAIMSEDGEPDFVYYVFDTISDKPFQYRIPTIVHPRIKLVEHVLINNEEELLALEKKYLEMGYEGMMIRAVSSPYKFGKSTENEAYLLKVKRFLDSEAIIFDFLPEYENLNEQVVNELGKKKRSSSKKNKVAKDTCGALVVRDIVTGVQFKISSGLTDDIQKKLWYNQDEYKGKLVKYKYMPSVKDKPRHPTFLGFRDERDMDAL